jgi:putative inorganic carbon (HCO3(-)) transporter
VSSPTRTPTEGAQPPLAAIPAAGWLASADLPFWCLTATCALLPAYVVRWHVGFLPTTLLEAAILVTAAAYAVSAWRSGLTPAWRSPFTLPAGLFLLAGLISVAVSPVHLQAAGLFRAYIVEPLLLFLVVTNLVRTEERARWLLYALWLGGTAAAIPNILVVLQAWWHHTLHLEVAAPVVIYQTPNAVSLFLVPLIALAGAVVVHARDQRLRVVAGLFGALAAAACLTSFSRGGYAALAAVLVGLALSHRFRLWLLSAFVVIGVVFSRLPPIASRLAHEVNASDPNNSLQLRAQLWKATLRMLRDHPVFGNGLSGFARTITPYRQGQFEEQLIYPHNIVLNFWTETGLLGLAAFAWLLLQAFRATWRGWRLASEAWRPYHLGVLLALVGILVHGLVDVPYWKNDLSAEFWILVGLSVAGLRADRLLRERS